MPRPRRDRPDLPEGYISRAPKGMLGWPAVEKILLRSPYLWIATTDADGRPHLVQQWGVWVDGILYFEGSQRTRWARNLARDPRLGFGMQVADRAVYGDAIADVLPGVEQSSRRRSRSGTPRSTDGASSTGQSRSSTRKVPCSARVR